ncbi:hypothetical protein TC41_2519 [Alicyclobacillus acidocaldarius subsp. acidocaldarius Tc-4-1]|uniref:HTH cro/C1-type domain-containing protein n=2 Tax=Alicyclobacillus acidocaldarius TaxID=405212 RepID=F8IHE3_ALIAT|nr:hypothetical protein TC41_2519 [Alicyclobacillus acidocaldarius subsp. acidocaldarius Tc-4-1]
MNMTQRELAMKVGISRPHLANIEAGRKISGLRIAKKLAKELNTTIDDLFGDDVPKDDKK